MTQEVQRRYVNRDKIKLQERSDGATPTIVGYAAVYYNSADPKGTQYQLWGELYERIMPGAFDKAIQTDDVRAHFNHDSNVILGRTTAGTLRLSSDSRGLRYEIDPPETQTARDLIASIRRGDVSGSSFAFIPRAETFREATEPGQPTYVEVLDVQLFDVGPVVYPAYSGTEAGIRAEGVDAEKVKARVQQYRSAIQQDREAIAVLLRDDDTDTDDTETDGPKVLPNVPDIRQQYDYDCGAAATAIVCGMMGVGPDPTNLDTYRTALGTTEEDGTHADMIVAYLASLGLMVDAENDRTVQNLEGAIAAGAPIICCIQDWEDSPNQIPEEQSGHYVVVIGAGDDTMILQDPWAGRVSMKTIDFLSRWEDADQSGEFVHYGIVVSKSGN